MKLKAIWIAAILLLAATALGTQTFAQVTTAAIHGMVVDSSGAAIPGADISVLNTSTGISSMQSPTAGDISP